MKVTRLLVSFSLIWVNGCGRTSDVSATLPVDASVVNAYGGKDGFAPIAEPETVEAFRLDVHIYDPEEGAPPKNTMARHAILFGPVEVDPQTAARLATLLRDPRVYIPLDNPTDCAFSPGVGLRFTGRKSVTEVLLCFRCGQMAIARGGDVVLLDGFGQIYLQMAEIMKGLFPDDREIQKLGSQRP